ncbi:MAG: Lrp/AsnC family transcriptional regulator [Candidatus Aenigmarchaeota archaeon]|nr:Lrp/AsnC family transcriptional regulator [Candidatus Aenigmarchaeota archaeon]
MDKKDEKILETLKADSSLTTRQISRKTLMPVTTVHNRIRKLREEGVIKQYTVKVDYRKLGKTFTAILLVSCDYKVLRETGRNQHDLVKEMMKLAEVESADIVTGATDIVLRVRTKDVEAFDEFLFRKLQTISGVEKTQSLVVINER